MKRIAVRYTVRPEAVGENETYVKAVFAELARTGPSGIRYATFKLADGVSFMHVASIETDDGTNPLQAVAAFKEFASTVKDRCVEPAVTTELEEIGSYRFFGE